jgi:centromeric protein E
MRNGFSKNEYNSKKIHKYSQLLYPFFVSNFWIVAIRMRPMNNKESEGRRVWRVLQKYNSITQTTPHGKPLPDRASGKTFFTFDKIFGEDSTTTQIYNDVVKKIVNSAVSGLNGTIFAYGQTSSGKTFTMSGGGLRQPEVHGIIQMAGKDIFSKIAAHPCRVFLLRVSFIEIYNEEVRDLLVSGVAQGSGAKLAIREDPRRGFFVNANETFVTDLETLISVMSAGEKNRAVGSTAMNERSSRSHTIFRITLESRKRKTASDEDGVSDYEDEGKSDRTSLQDDDDDGTVLVSTLSLVDLAGSESVRHTGATGERQKEGGRINQR